MSGFFPDDTDFVTHEFVTPRYRATSAPEYPNSRTAIQDTIPLASTISLLRLPEHSSPRLMPCFLQTLPANMTISTCHPESRRFFFQPIPAFGPVVFPFQHTSDSSFVLDDPCQNKTIHIHNLAISCQPCLQALNDLTNDNGSAP